MSLRTVLLNTTMLAGIAGASLLAVDASRAADIEVVKPAFKAPLPLAPAVDGVNAKLEGLGGSVSGKGIYGSRGAVSLPLAAQWGVQVDGAAGSLERRAFGSVGGHLFWRNPAQGLLGLYVSHTRWNRFGGVQVTQVAGEGELYWGRWTLQGIAGVEFGNSASSLAEQTTVIPPGGGPFGPAGVITTNSFVEGYDVKTRFFDQVNLKYYFTDDWAGYVGHRYLGGRNALALGAEAALPLGKGAMASAFVEARAGERQFHGVWGGLRFYFGQKDKTLIRRHREDDPIVWDTLFSILNNYHSFASSSSTLFCNPPQVLQPDGTCEAGLIEE